MKLLRNSVYPLNSFKMVICNILFCIVNLAGIVFAVLSLVTNDWFILLPFSIDIDIRTYCGLWSCCTTVYNFTADQVNISYSKSSVTLLTKVTMVVGCITYVFAFALIMLNYLNKVRNNKLSGYMLLTTAICLTTGIIVLTRDIFRNEPPGFAGYSASYFEGGIAGGISITSAILQFFRTKSEYEPF
ncbi:uncharacterized protein LOC124818300 [Hydra vulgaris]|uniref:uncharacterized protein LOC124818300 n=1 Tax=Hydra vulgaris TaxID=6087 RepID=UPI0032EA84DE